ncbi:MAG TPA: twin-arginine translocase subunit TatC, partial [Syntrophorhabdaceae bacterium]|nr:twin-arginine translocase subunit TatC [Syntrophorhabdaceae bacterium]
NQRNHFEMKSKTFHLMLASLRRFAIEGLIFVAVSSAVCFVFYRRILDMLLETVHIKVYYFTFQEVFFSSIELSVYAGIFLSVPVFVAFLWREFGHLINIRTREKWLFAVFAVLLFYAGSLFCCFLVLQSGVKFLLGYEGDSIKAMISVEKFIRFSSAMIFAFGLAFELPVVLIALNKMGVVGVKTLTKTRRFAILFITIASAIITPTPDIYNMMLLAVPTYILYEASIFIMKINERKKGRSY